ncbi:MAG TPA: efflux RND transporter permease subunit [Ignavibacteria bacterium]|nr:efflux RND transporter permease subunit [Ignavibacteria bacterium]HQY52398.1 efflux RND transporter permease subunit [Ignavibacteria bacterium]HRB00146.1 efflux RND transporter permease subunit [Ignavibacteria bacterium]
MSISNTSINRPVLAIVMSLILIIFGLVSIVYLEVREYPSVDPPIVNVTTIYPGANSEVIESQITEPLEQSLNGIEGIKTLTSESREQSSRITLEFELSRNLEDAANDVRDRVSRAQRNLPPDIDNPIVQKADADATPIIFMFLQSDTKSILEVSDFATNVIKERVQTIAGVSSVNIFGEKKYSMRLWLDPQRLAAYKLTPLDVQIALERENVELPSGRIEGDNTELSVRTLGRFKDAEEFNELVIVQSGENTVKLKDIGYAVIGAENERTAVKRGGTNGIGISVQAIPGSNIIEISDEFKKRFEVLKEEIPPEYRLEVGFDFSTFVRSTILEVEETIVIAFILVLIVIFVFLRDWRSTLIPVVAIPVSIIAGFFVIYLVGYSINVLTLVAIILAIGLVVDDAIVVLENIYSKIEDGMSPMEAARKGSKEIYFAVISTTITLAAVFLPLLFLEGLIGKLFKEFGVVVASTVIISSFVALTLTPMLSSRLLKKHTKSNKFYNATEPFFAGMTRIYEKMLFGFMKIRWMAIVLIILMGVFVYFLKSDIQTELAPLEDRSNVRIQALGPEGSTFEYTEKYMDELSQYVMDSIPEAISPITIIAPSFGSPGATNIGIVNLFLVPPEDRVRTQQEIYKSLAKDLNTFTGIRGFPTMPPTIGSRFGRQPLQYVIQAPNFDKLMEVLPKILEEAKKSPKLQFVDADIKVNKPELTVSINREKASTVGVSTRDIARTLQIALGGQQISYFLKGGKQYQVIAQVDREYRDDPYDLSYLFVRNNKGELIQLDNLVTVEENISPTSRLRYNRYVSATIGSGLAPGVALGEAIEEMDRISAPFLDKTFSTSLAGESKDFAESSSSLIFTFIFAILIIFLVLSAQFESFIDPFIIILTVPLALTGALLSLWLFDMTLNIFSQIGIIMLIGLVTKNAILIVEFANQRKESGLSVLEAVKSASVSRFRPIVMTSLTTILGIMPIAVGAGAGSRTSLGIAVVGGLIFATFLTLFIVPAMYSYLSRKVVPATEEEIYIEDIGDIDFADIKD